MWKQKILHGSDYNPDQWLDSPEVLAKDIELMKQAHVNCVSVGMFAWTALEPEEGKYTFEWLEKCISTLYENGIYTMLATPSAARPAWMAHKYPEVLRVRENLQRNRMGERHNHCYTSPIYRQKLREIAVALSQKFGNHPGVLLWHLSNEYGGDCYCPLCQEAFRAWVKEKYQTLENVNKQWWSHFWSHTYTAWDQIEAPVPHGETVNYGLILDWKRFVTHQTVDFCKWEIQAVREGGSSLPVTTNLMGFYDGLNYDAFSQILDVVSWDSYPQWHNNRQKTEDLAAETASGHDLMRCIHPQKAPFLLMESTPSATNWQRVSKLKRPGMHMLSSLQAVAHGSNSVQYFQWRKGRGGSEKFHGAVIDHCQRTDTRVFQDVEELGQRLDLLDLIATTRVKAEVAIIFDQETRWALELKGGPRNQGMEYLQTVQAHHKAFWEKGIMVDLVSPETELKEYTVVVAPMLYLMPENRAEKLKQYVSQGGTLVGTYWGGVTNENDLCHLGETPYGLTQVYGLWREEIDALWDGEENAFQWQGKTYPLSQLCERIHVKNAQVLATYEKDFYKGEPVLCKNIYGKGKAYYLAAKAGEGFYRDFYHKIIKECKVNPSIKAQLPKGVTASKRVGEQEVIFVQNFQDTQQKLTLQAPYVNLETRETLQGEITLHPYEVLILGS
ncbi:MAG: beta-galactosidase [Clostridiales bacterium]|nr:beta-galactosidase [Clostridiales bacterium]